MQKYKKFFNSQNNIIFIAISGLKVANTKNWFIFVSIIAIE